MEPKLRLGERGNTSKKNARLCSPDRYFSQEEGLRFFLYRVRITKGAMLSLRNPFWQGEMILSLHVDVMKD